MKKLKRRQFMQAVAGGVGAGMAATVLAKNVLAAQFRPEVFSIAGADQYSIYTGSDPDIVVRFASEELQKYLEKISSIKLQINTIPVFAKKNVVLIAPSRGGVRSWDEMISGADTLPDDGFMLRTGKDFAALAGPNARGALYAVYAFLEALGCRFYGLGEEGEIIPRANGISVPQLDETETPTFRWRDWCEDSSYAHRTEDPDHHRRHEKFWLQLIDWFTKNRINMTGNSDYPSMNAEFEKRGIQHWHGGHLIPSLMPRELFAEHPDYFRMDPTGKRMANGNFCPSNGKALDLVAENAVKFVEKNPGTKNLEVWGEDVWDGSWCYCPECSRMTVQDQYLTACNAIARAVKNAGYTIDIDAIAYHDSVDPDVTVQPEPNLKLMWAPRERSYGHALNDMRSERNQWYAECFEKWAAIFGPKNMDLFEYYNDNILFRTFPVSCPHLIAQDVQYYTDIGLDNHYLLCHLGDYAFQSEPLSCYAYVRLIANKNQDIDAIIREYCADMYGPAGATMLKWHNDFEEAMHFCATFGDIQRVPTESSPRTEKLMSEISRSIKMLNEANLLVKRAKSETQDPLQKKRIGTQAWVNEFALLMVNGLMHQVRAEFQFGRVMTMVWGRMGGGSANPHEGLAGRYIQVRDEFKQAVDYYKKSSEFIRALPPEEHSVWCDTSLHSHNRGICNEMRAKITECEKHI